MISKQVILDIKNVYTANAFLKGGRTFVGAGSETEPVVKLYDLASGNIESMKDCPGGMMSLIPVPGHPESLVSVMGLFPPFLGKEAGLFLHQKKDELGRLPGPWTCLLLIAASFFLLRKKAY